MIKTVVREAGNEVMEQGFYMIELKRFLCAVTQLDELEVGGKRHFYADRLRQGCKAG